MYFKTLALSFICSFTVVRKRVLYASIGAVVIVILLVGLVILLKGSNETAAPPAKLSGGAIVANGLECAGIARYVI